MSKNISKIKDCFGCGVCAVACPKKIIEIDLNQEGFYEPRIIDLDKCIHCKLCLDVCSYYQEGLSVDNKIVRSYAAWSNDELVRRKCSSGGIGFEILRSLIEKGYKFCGVKYDTIKCRAEHYIANSLHESEVSIGSKYIQSYTVDGFRQINRRDKYLVSGTPCQIDLFRRYIRKVKIEDNFVLMDFFCHSVPSLKVWKKYCQLVEQTVGTIETVSWRNKTTGWHDSWSIAINETNNIVKCQNSYHLVNEEKESIYNSRLSENDVFYKLFLGDFCINKACRKNCKYKYKQSAADIRIGDLWGKTYKDDDKGVSALITFTVKGQSVVDSLNNCELTPYPFEIVAEGQMKVNAHKAYLDFIAKTMIESSFIFSKRYYAILFFVEKMLHFPRRIVNKLKKLNRHG